MELNAENYERVKDAQRESVWREVAEKYGCKVTFGNKGSMCIDGQWEIEPNGRILAIDRVEVLIKAVLPSIGPRWFIDRTLPWSVHIWPMD